MPPLFKALSTIALGLITGSYLNVVVHRIPRGISTVRPRSACPNCATPIRALDNIPVLSYLWLRGRCRHCGHRIGLRYPLVELGTAGLFWSCFATFGWSLQAAVAAVFCSLLFALALIDLEHLLLPDRITLPAVALGLALQPWIAGVTFLDAVLGTLVGAGLLILLINVWYWIREEEGMGLGDVNLIAMIGAFLGWKGVALSLLAGALAGALFGVAMMALRRLGMSSKLPFGTFLAIGALVALFSQGRIVDAYLRLL